MEYDCAVILIIGTSSRAWVEGAVPKAFWKSWVLGGDVKEGVSVLGSLSFCS